MQPREFDLKLAFMAARAGAKDFEDECDAVEHFDAEVALEVALLSRAQCLIEDHALGAVLGHDELDFIGLARAHEQCGIGSATAGDDPGDRLIARRLGQQGQFIQRRIEGRVCAEIDPDQNSAWERGRVRCSQDASR